MVSYFIGIPQLSFIDIDKELLLQKVNSKYFVFRLSFVEYNVFSWESASHLVSLKFEITPLEPIG